MQEPVCAGASIARPCRKLRFSGNCFRVHFAASAVRGGGTPLRAAYGRAFGKVRLKVVSSNYSLKYPKRAVIHLADNCPINWNLSHTPIILKSVRLSYILKSYFFKNVLASSILYNCISIYCDHSQNIKSVLQN